MDSKFGVPFFDVDAAAGNLVVVVGHAVGAPMQRLGSRIIADGHDEILFISSAEIPNTCPQRQTSTPMTKVAREPISPSSSRRAAATRPLTRCTAIGEDVSRFGLRRVCRNSSAFGAAVGRGAEIVAAGGA